MKRHLCLLLVLSMLVCPFFNLSPNSQAATVTQDGSTTTTLTYGVSSAYIVTIPDSIVLDANDPVDFTITTQNIIIPYGAYLNVMITSENSSFDGERYWMTSPTSGNKIGYTILETDPDAWSNQNGITGVYPGYCLQFNRHTEPNKTIQFVMSGDANLAYADQYIDTITFAIGLSNFTHEATTDCDDCMGSSWGGTEDVCGICGACAAHADMLYGGYWQCCYLCGDCHAAKNYVCEYTEECFDCGRWLPTKYMDSYGQCSVCASHND